MSHTYSFEKLEVWQESRILVVWIYGITNKFPAEEKFGLVTQMRRASISVVSNLAEGSARKSSKEQAYFTQLAFSSLIELLNQIIIASDLSYLSGEELSEGRLKIENLTKKISALRNVQLAKLNSKLSTQNQ